MKESLVNLDEIQISNFKLSKELRNRIVSIRENTNLSTPTKSSPLKPKLRVNEKQVDLVNQLFL
jgi:hypothetical protein